MAAARLLWLLVSEGSGRGLTVRIGGGHNIEQVQRGGCCDHIVQQVVVMQALPPLQTGLRQLGPAAQDIFSHAGLSRNQEGSDPQILGVGTTLAYQASMSSQGSKRDSLPAPEKTTMACFKPDNLCTFLARLVLQSSDKTPKGSACGSSPKEEDGCSAVERQLDAQVPVEHLVPVQRDGRHCARSEACHACSRRQQCSRQHRAKDHLPATCPQEVDSVFSTLAACPGRHISVCMSAGLLQSPPRCNITLICYN